MIVLLSRLRARAVSISCRLDRLALHTPHPNPPPQGGGEPESSLPPVGSFEAGALRSQNPALPPGGELRGWSLEEPEPGPPPGGEGRNFGSLPPCGGGLGWGVVL